MFETFLLRALPCLLSLITGTREGRSLQSGATILYLCLGVATRATIIALPDPATKLCSVDRGAGSVNALRLYDSALGPLRLDHELTRRVKGKAL
jgi:hypothetical protein